MMQQRQIVALARLADALSEARRVHLVPDDAVTVTWQRHREGVTHTWTTELRHDSASGEYQLANLGRQWDASTIGDNDDKMESDQ